MFFNRRQRIVFFVAIALLALTATIAAFAGEGTLKGPEGSSLLCIHIENWYTWAIILFVLNFVIGILAVLAGVGGGVLFVPIVGGLFPFGLDYVRGAGLFVALAGALAAGPGLLNRGLANLKLAMPFAIIASTASIFGAMVGLALPEWLTRILLGSAIVGIVILLAMAKKSEFPDVPKADRMSTVLGISGIYHEASLDKQIDWKIHRTPIGILLFVGIGFMAGMFGLGAGWANVPVFNLLLGAPLKISVATSKFLLAITDTAAAWIYFMNGALKLLIAVPSIAGIMLGSLIGIKILAKVKPKSVKWVVIALLAFAGLFSIYKGLGSKGIL